MGEVNIVSCRDLVHDRPACGVRPHRYVGPHVRGGWIAAAQRGAVLLVVLFGASLASSAPQTSQKLLPNEPIEQAHGSNEPFRYLVDCPPGGACLVTIDQLGLDLAVSVDSSAGSWHVNSPLKRDEREIVVLEKGSYEIVVVSEEFTGARGRHRIEHQRIDSGAPALAVWRSMSKAARANAHEDWQQSLDTYLQAAELADTLDMPHLRKRSAEHMVV